MIRPKENEKECAKCHCFIPLDGDMYCPACRERADNKVHKLYVTCDNCDKVIRVGEEFDAGTRRCCSMRCKQELEELQELQ